MAKIERPYPFQALVESFPTGGQPPNDMLARMIQENITTQYGRVSTQDYLSRYEQGEFGPLSAAWSPEYAAYVQAANLATPEEIAAANALNESRRLAGSSPPGEVFSQTFVTTEKPSDVAAVTGSDAYILEEMQRKSTVPGGDAYVLEEMQSQGGLLAEHAREVLGVSQAGVNLTPVIAAIAPMAIGALGSIVARLGAMGGPWGALAGVAGSLGIGLLAGSVFGDEEAGGGSGVGGVINGGDTGMSTQLSTTGLGGIQLGGPGLAEPSSKIVVKEWRANNCQFYLVQPSFSKSSRRILCYNRTTGVWTGWKPKKHIVVSANPRVGTLISAAKRIDNQMLRFDRRLGKFRTRTRITHKRRR